MTCKTHRHACKCREAEFAKLRASAQTLVELVDAINKNEAFAALRKMLKAGPERDPQTLLKNHPQSAKSRARVVEQRKTPVGVSSPQPGVIRHKICP